MDPNAPSRTKYRLRFAKRGDLRFVSHRDVVKVFERAARVADLPLAWSGGFNPRPKIAVCLALTLGVAAERDAVEVELEQPIDPAEVAARWQAALPEGMELHAPVQLPPKTPAARVRTAHYRLVWPEPPLPPGVLSARVRDLLLAREAPLDRTGAGAGRTVDVRRYVEHCGAEGDTVLIAALRVDASGTIRAEELLRALGLPADALLDAEAVRTDLDLVDES
jgi:radical SAM-linked protein